MDKRYATTTEEALDNIRPTSRIINWRVTHQARSHEGRTRRRHLATSQGGGGGSGEGSDNDGGAISADEQQAQANDTAELDAITGDANDAKPEVKVGNEQLEPGANGLFDLASASNDVPTPLLLALIAIGVLALAGGVVALRGRVPALARIPLVSKIPRVSLPRFRR